MKSSIQAKYLIYVSVAFIFGIYPGVFYGHGLSFYVIPLVSLLAIFLYIFSSIQRVLIYCIILFYTLGCIRGYTAENVANDYANISGVHSEILVDTVSDQKPSSYGQVQVELKELDKKQKILALVPSSQDPVFGMRWLLSGTVHTMQNLIVINTDNSLDNLQGFNYGGYLRSEGIYAKVNAPQLFLIGASANFYTWTQAKNTIFSFAYRLKDYLYKKIFYRYDDKTVNLLKAVLFGDKSGLGNDKIKQYILSGSVHLIAVSGFKLTLLLIFIQFALRPVIGRKVVFVLNCIVCFWYDLVFSFAPPIVRASLMSIIFNISEFAGGGYDVFRLLLPTAAIMAFVNPLSLVYDSSFLFSFLGILGIISLNGIFKNLAVHSRIKIPNLIFEFFVIPLSAFIYTIPLSIYSYSEIAFISPLASLLLTPLLSPCIVLGYISAVPIIGALAAIINKYILWYFDFLPEKISSIKFTHIEMHFDGRVIYVVYLVIFAFYTYLKNRKSSVKMT